MIHRIPFNSPLVLGAEKESVLDAIDRKEFCGGGHYNNLCEDELKKITRSQNVLMTSSCTHALEMCALLLDIKKGDEIIMSSFNFVSAANAFVLRGAKIVFIDIRPDTLNIDENLIESAITKKTRAILTMHYGGVPCEMEIIMSIAKKHNLIVIEDAAHCVGAYYKGRHLGSIGDLGTLSFHSTKNVQCGEGGALLINNELYSERAEIIREKGTNRKQFLDGVVEKYTWVEIGSSFLCSELNCAFLLDQLRAVKHITEVRERKSRMYLEIIPDHNEFQKQALVGNGHVFYLIFSSLEKRNRRMLELVNHGVSAYFHYVPLHTSKAGRKYSTTCGSLNNAINISNRILRLPLFYDISEYQQNYVARSIENF